MRDRNTGDVKCSINITAPLKVCVDENASAGSNSYAIYGVWPGGSWGPKTFTINGLQQDRTYFFNITTDFTIPISLCRQNHYKVHQILSYCIRSLPS